MRSPIAALTWDIWQRNRRLVWLVIGIVVFAWIFNLVLPVSFHAPDNNHSWLGALNFTMAFVSLLLVFGIFSYTEFNPKKESIGFPQRLFVLPVTSLVIVALPISLGIAGVELVYLAWAWLELAFAHGDSENLKWSAVLIGAYMVFYQTILWSLSGLRSLRMVVLGLIAIILIVVAFLPTFPGAVSSLWFSEAALSVLIAGLALCAFLIAWMVVARERSGGASRRNLLKVLVEWLSDRLPRRKKGFRSPGASQFWFEWRCSGSQLPLCTGAILLLVIVPLSWHMRNEADSSLRILVATLVMPTILALPIGKAFSKPNFWSADLLLPAFIAVRPLATEEIVLIKMKVAAVSTAISWLLVLGFVSIWLPFRMNSDGLNMLRNFIWQIYGHSLYAQYAIGVLLILAGMFLTWRFLVGGLWIGLSGNRKLFAASAVPYGFVPVLGMIGVILLLRDNETFLGWIRNNLDRLLPKVVWFAALAVMAKFWLAAFSWRKINPQRLRQYIVVWSAGTVCLVTLAILLCPGLSYLLRSDIYRVRSLLILIALLIIPFGRLGLATSSLENNRHQ